MKTIPELQHLQKLRKQLGALDAPGPALRETPEYNPLVQLLGKGIDAFDESTSFLDIYSWIYDEIQRQMIDCVERGGWIPVEVALPRADGDSRFAGSFPRSKTVLVTIEGQSNPAWGHYSIMGDQWVIESFTIVGDYPVKVVAWQEIAPYEQK